MVRKVLQPFYTAFVVGTFTFSILISFPFFLLLSIGNNNRSRRFIYSIIRYWAICWLWMIGMALKKYGNRSPKGRYVIVANHISYLDTLNIFAAIPCYFRALGKKEISKIPLIGFIYKQLVIMVDRENIHSRSRSMRLLWRVLHHEGSIVIFPEGTFNETGDTLKEFYNGAFRLAINTQTPILPMVFPDTIKRWHYGAWWQLWPGQNRVVYLDPIPVAGLTIENLPALKQKVYSTMESALTKYRLPT